MASEKLQVILELVTGQYKREAKEAATATGQIGTAAKSVTGGLTGLQTGINRLQGAFVALGVTAVIGQFRDMAKAAAEDAEAQEILAQALRTNIGATDEAIATNERWISTMQIATRTADNDLRQALTNLTVSGRSLEESQKDIGIAIDIAASKGIALDSVIKGLVRSLGSGSTAGLSRLGIATKNAAGEMLSYDEVLQEAAKTMGGTAARAAGTLAGALERSKIAMEEAREEAGGNFLPTMVTLQDAWNRFMTAVLGGNNQLAALQTVFNMLITGGVDPFEDAVASAGFVMAQLANSIKTPIEDGTFETLVAMLGLTNDQVIQLRSNFIRNGAAVVENDEALTGIIRVLDQYVGVADPAVLATRRYQKAQEDAAGATRDYTDALQAQRDLLKEMTDPLFALVAAGERYEDAQRRLNEQTVEGKRGSDEYNDALGDLLRAQAELNQAVADANAVGSDGLDLLQQLAVQAGVNAEAFDLWAASVRGLAGAISSIPARVGGRPTITSGGPNVRGQFHEGGVVPGPRGSPQPIMALGGETVLPTHKGGFSGGSVTRIGPTLIINNPNTHDLRTDAQYLTILASVTNLVEGGL